MWAWCLQWLGPYHRGSRGTAGLLLEIPHVSGSTFASAGLSSLLFGHGINTAVGVLRKQNVASHLWGYRVSLNSLILLGFSFPSKHSGFLNRGGGECPSDHTERGWGLGDSEFPLPSHPPPYFCGIWCLQFLSSGSFWGTLFLTGPLLVPTYLKGTWAGPSSSLLSCEPSSLHFLPSSIMGPWKVEFSLFLVLPVIWEWVWKAKGI